MIYEREYSGGSERANVAWRGVRELWEQQLLCDVRLVVEGRVFKVHRCYLASCCQYFHTMFTQQGFKESAENQITMQGVTAEGLSGILHYMYTGVISIKPDNINDILQAASLLQVVDVEAFCSQYFKDCLTVENCLEYLTVTDAYALHETSEEIIAFLLENYSSLSQTREFLNECNFDLLCKLMELDSLNVESEFIVFQSAVKWLKHIPHRIVLAVKVLKLVRFGLMNSKEMELVKAEDIFNQPGCAELLQESIEYHAHPYKQPIVDAYFARPRTSVPSLVVLMISDSTLTNIMLASSVKLNELATFTTSEPIDSLKLPRRHMGTAVVNNFLFIVGGELDDYIEDTAFRYNPTNQEWLELASMECPRSWFVLLSLLDCLVAVGGVVVEEMDASVEKYSFEKNSWSRLPSLGSVVHHAGCTHEGCVYISGGSYRESPDFQHGASNRVQCYDPAQGVWTQKCTLNFGRSGHLMVSYGENIFVCGGSFDILSGDIFATEMYNLKTDQWSIVTPMPVGRESAVAACHGNSLFVLGGENGNEEDECESVLRFDLDTLQWTVLGLHVHLPHMAHWIIAHFLEIPHEMYE